MQSGLRFLKLVPLTFCVALVGCAPRDESQYTASTQPISEHETPDAETVAAPEDLQDPVNPTLDAGIHSHDAHPEEAQNELDLLYHQRANEFEAASTPVEMLRTVISQSDLAILGVVAHIEAVEMPPCTCSNLLPIMTRVTFSIDQATFASDAAELFVGQCSTVTIMMRGGTLLNGESRLSTGAATLAESGSYTLILSSQGMASDVDCHASCGIATTSCELRSIDQSQVIEHAEHEMYLGATVDSEDLTSVLAMLGAASNVHEAAGGAHP
jgi:hypothetical protein